MLLHLTLIVYIKTVFHEVNLNNRHMDVPAVTSDFKIKRSLDYVTSVDLWSDIIAVDYPSPHILRLYIHSVCEPHARLVTNGMIALFRIKRQ